MYKLDNKIIIRKDTLTEQEKYFLCFMYLYIDEDFLELSENERKLPV